MQRKIIISAIVSIFAIVIIFIIFMGTNKSYSVSACIDQYLRQNGIMDYEVKEIADYKECQIEKKQASVYEQEIQKYIDVLLESYAYMVPVEDRQKVQKDDFVYVSYDVYVEQNKVKTVSGDVLKVGSGYYDAQFENLLLDAVVGEPFMKKLTVENENGKEQEQKFVITVDSINQYVTFQLDEAFVQSNLGYDSVEEFYRETEKKLLQEEQVSLDSDAENKLLKDLISDSKIILNEEEVANYAQKGVSLYEQMAYVYNMTLSEYYETKLGLTKAEFFEKCFVEAKDELETELIIGVIAELEHVNVSEQELQEYLENQDETNENEAECQLLRQKVMKLFKER